MSQGQYWTGSKWVTPEEMTRTRRTLTGKSEANPSLRAFKQSEAKPVQQETTNDRRSDDKPDAQ